MDCISFSLFCKVAILIPRLSWEMSHPEIEKLNQDPRLGLVHSKGFTAVPSWPDSSFSKNLGDPRGLSSNLPPPFTCCVALGQLTNLSELLFLMYKKSSITCTLPSGHENFCLTSSTSEGTKT